MSITQAQALIASDLLADWARNFDICDEAYHLVPKVAGELASIGQDPEGASTEEQEAILEDLNFILRTLSRCNLSETGLLGEIDTVIGILEKPLSPEIESKAKEEWGLFRIQDIKPEVILVTLASLMLSLLAR